MTIAVCPKCGVREANHNYNHPSHIPLRLRSADTNPAAKQKSTPE
jgi:predicted component of type VI protein secretion system